MRIGGRKVPRYISISIYVLVFCALIALLKYAADDDLKSSISPTAHYTGYVWYRNALSDSRLFTFQGAILYWLFEPVMFLSRLRGKISTEQYLLARHTTIDRRLKSAITDRDISHVIEIASGFSPRGLRFAREYNSSSTFTYIETDLPDMAAKKQSRLKDLLHNNGRRRHYVVAANMLFEEGPESLHELIQQLPKDRPVALIMEGLLSYYDIDTVKKMWQRVGKQLRLFPRGSVYMSDLRFSFDDSSARWILSKFVKGKVYVHFDTYAEAVHTVRNAAGFREVEIVDTGLESVQIIECWT